MARILVVEHVEELAEELRAAVGTGHETIPAASRSDALRVLQVDIVDLVITALVLETGDYREGLDVIRAARERNPAVQAIIVTSYSTPATCREAIGVGVFDYIERNSPGLDFFEFLRCKIALALVGHHHAGATL